MVTTTETYAFMAAAAYDERRGDEGPAATGFDKHTRAIEDYLQTTDGGAWFKAVTAPGTGASPGWNNADGASYSDPTTGMQADVWTKGSEYVIAFRGTEGSRAGSNDGFRSGDGLKGKGTLDGKTNHFAPAL